jgi:hypothetical protein
MKSSKSSILNGVLIDYYYTPTLQKLTWEIIFSLHDVAQTFPLHLIAEYYALTETRLLDFEPMVESQLFFLYGKL